MADQSSSSTLQNKLDRRSKGTFNIAIGLSKSDGNKLGFSGYHKDSSRILGSDMNYVNQDHKRRCLEKLMTQEDVKCALEVQVIDDTALIGTTVAVTRFKNHRRSQTDTGFEKNPRNKEENGGEKKRNKGFKKQQIRCSTKCLNEKKPSVHVVEDKRASKKQIPESKLGHKGYRKTVKYVYKKKEITKKVENQIQESTDVTLKVFDEDEKVSETVNEKDFGLKLSPEVIDLIQTESEGENVSATTAVESKKTAYARAEMEALRFVDEPGQRTKWAEVYGGFAPLVAREYTELVVDANNRPTQRYNRVVNCVSGSCSSSTSHANPILAMPPVLPLCSPTNHRKFDRVGYKVSLN